jgi:hypothetical protein
VKLIGFTNAVDMTLMGSSASFATRMEGEFGALVAGQSWSTEVC